MTEVRFESGIEELDGIINRIPELGFLFNAINLNRTTKNTRANGNHSVIIPSLIDVTMFTDFDDQMSYAVKSYLDLDQGRMVVGDFVVKQAWIEHNNKNTMQLVSDEGEVLSTVEENAAIALSFIAEAYRLGHYAKANGEL